MTSHFGEVILKQRSRLSLLYIWLYCKKQINMLWRLTHFNLVHSSIVSILIWFVHVWFHLINDGTSCRVVIAVRCCHLAVNCRCCDLFRRLSNMGIITIKIILLDNRSRSLHPKRKRQHRLNRLRCEPATGRLHQLHRKRRRSWLWLVE
jgi:hypothetical protein